MNTNPIHFDAEYASHDRVQAAAGQLVLHAGAGHRAVGDRSHGQRRRQPGLGRGAAAESAVRGRHGLLEERSAGDARIEVAAERRHRPSEDDGHEPARRGGDRVHAHVHDLEARACAPQAQVLEHERRKRSAGLQFGSTFTWQLAPSTQCSCQQPTSSSVSIRAAARAPRRSGSGNARRAHARNFASSSASLAGCSG